MFLTQFIEPYKTSNVTASVVGLNWIRCNLSGGSYL